MSNDATDYGGYFFVIILIIALITNPDNLQKHKEGVLKYYNEKYLGLSDGNSDLQNAERGAKNINKIFESYMIEPYVGFKNYYVFSLTTVSDKVVGIGVFSKVFVFELDTTAIPKQ
jgi:hypothetical protein